MFMYFGVAVKTALLLVIVFLCWLVAPQFKSGQFSAGYVQQRFALATSEDKSPLSVKDRFLKEPDFRSGPPQTSTTVQTEKATAPRLTEKLETAVDEVRGGEWYRRLIQKKKEHQIYSEMAPIIALVIIGGIIAGVFATVLSVGDLKSLLGNDFLLHFVGLVVIVLTVSMFGLIGTFEARDLTTIFSAIAGYILGQGVNRKCVIYSPPPNQAPDPSGNSG